MFPPVKNRSAISGEFRQQYAGNNTKKQAFCVASALPASGNYTFKRQRCELK